MPGWVIAVLVVLAAAALFALAWWSSGRERPRARAGQGSRMSQAEQDYLSSGADRRQGQYGSFGGGGGT